LNGLQIFFAAKHSFILKPLTGCTKRMLGLPYSRDFGHLITEAQD